MTRILWHSCAPWDGTGYGTQTATWARYLRKQGHDVAISAYHGAPGFPITWEGIPVYPPPLAGPVTELVPGHADDWGADLVIILADVWTMNPRLLADHKQAVWLPTDTDKISLLDYNYLAVSGATPIAMSEHARVKLERAGFSEVLYVPHGIDTAVFAPPPDRGPVRYAHGLAGDTFAVGLNMNNIDPVRKAIPENMAAFARFHEKHPDSVLFVHTIAEMRHDGSLSMGVLEADLGIKGAVRYCNQYTHLSGGYSQADMAGWYAAMDVVSNATYGEGFGLPALEAQACGTPVIVSRGTTGPQLAGPARWLVGTQRRWNQVHGAWWHAPSEDGIVARLEQAYAARGSSSLREKCRAFAEGYSVERVGPMWDEALSKLTP